MKELRKLTEIERADIISSCCSGFISYNDTKVVASVSKVLLEVVGKKSLIKEIKTIVTLTGSCMRKGCSGSQLPMSDKVYVEANKITKQGISGKRMRDVISLLDTAGYIEYYKGYKDAIEDRGVTGCFIVKPVFYNLFSSKAIRTFKKEYDVNNTVEVKDENGDLISKLTRFPNVSRNRKIMQQYNDCLSQNVVTLKGNSCYVRYKQVFSVDLSGAGRLYTMGGFQTMDSNVRQFIQINGRDTVEYDITSNHLSIMYTLKGITLDKDFDCYYVDLGKYNYKDVRLLCKLAIMCMINCKTKSGAYKALAKIIDKDNKTDSKGCLSSFVDDASICKRVIDALQKIHESITFFTRGEVLWRKLQRLDSRVCENVVQHYTERGIPILCWHDSWRVSKDHEKTLPLVIKESWFDVFGTYDNCFIKKDK